MRIVYLSVSAALGGAERMLLETLRAVRGARPAWDLRLILPEDGPLAAPARALGVGVDVHPLPRGLAELGDFPATIPDAATGAGRRWPLVVRLGAVSGPAFRHLLVLRRALRRLAPDILHANGLKMNVLAAWSRPAGTPVVWHVHDYVSPRPWTSRMVRRTSRRCDRAIAVSQSVAADLRAVCGTGLPVMPIHNAIDLEVFTPDGPAADLDTLAGLPPPAADTVRVGLVATMAHWKGHQVFLEALAALPAGLPVRGYVVGGPIYQTRGSQHALDSLRQLADRLGLASRVGFTGFVGQTADVMRALDIVVHASTRPEPFGLVVAEGMACARAVIAANAGGVTELVEPGTDALVHTPGDSRELADWIATLAAEPSLRAQLGLAARRAAVARFARSRYVDQLLAVYRDLAPEAA